MKVTKQAIRYGFKKRVQKEGGRLYVLSTENEQIEYKKSFHSSSDRISKEYLPTIAGFANNKGGVLIFGVNPHTFELVGIKPKYKSFDSNCLSNSIKEKINGTFYFEWFTLELSDLLLGFIMITLSPSKPAILINNIKVNNVLYKTGDIYFRYPGQTRRIAPDDLRTLIDKQVSRKSRSVLKHINSIIEMGPENVSLLNNASGEISTANKASKVYLSQEVVEKLNLIDEGKFVETNGSPAYVIKGEIYTSRDAPTIRRELSDAIYGSKINDAFFSDKCENPLVYISSILCGDTPYRPLYFFIRKANISRKKAIKYIQENDLPDIRKSTRSKILDRLTGKMNISDPSAVVREIEVTRVPKSNIDNFLMKVQRRNSIKGNRTKSIIRTIVYNRLMAGQYIPKSAIGSYSKECLEAFVHLAPSFIRSNGDFIFRELIKLRSHVISNDLNKSKSILRKAISYVDEAMYKS